MNKLRIRHFLVCVLAGSGVISTAMVEGHEMKGSFNPPLHHLRELQFHKTSDPLVDWNAIRNWTASDGRKLKAKILSAEGSTATFLLQNGKEAPIPLERLSEEDQRFIKEWSEIAQYFDTGYREASNLTGLVEAEIRDGAFAKDGKVHETRNFRFECDEELKAAIVKDFSRLFEATYLAVKSLPLGLEAAQPKDGKFVVRLFAKQADYLAAGGMETAAGIYILDSREILIPLSSLGLTVGSGGVRKTSDFEPGTLIHETVHAVTHQWLNIIPIWFAEGLAEYIAALPYNDGALDFKGLDRGLRERVAKKFGGDAKRFALVSPHELVKLDDRVFMAQAEVESEPIILPKIEPFRIQLLRNGEEPEPANPPASESGPNMTMPTGGGLIPPQIQDDTIVVRRYASSMLLVDHLLRTGQSEALRKYLFSFLHHSWDSITYLGLYRETHKAHIANLDAQSAEFDTVLKDYNSKINAYNNAINRYNAGEIDTVPEKPADPEAPEAIPVPEILANPRSPDDLSRKAFRQTAADGVLKIPAVLGLPE